MHSICIILLLQQKYSASLQHRHNWCQLPLHIARSPSRANCGALVPTPMVALPFRQVLTSVYLTPAPPTPHPVHLSHVGSNQPVHRHPSIDNGSAPVLAPIVELPFRWVLTSVRPTPVPPTPHQVHPSHTSHTSHPSHPGSNQPMHKSRCVLIQPIRSNTIRSNTIRSNPIQSIRSG